MKVNFSANRFQDIFSNWQPIYIKVMNAFYDLGYEVCASPLLKMKDMPSFVNIGIKDNLNDVYVYNHTTLSKIKETGFIVSNNKNIFIKPTGPTSDHFTLDHLGYASATSITYQKPNFESVNSNSFYFNEVSKIKKNKINKWSGVKHLTPTDVIQKIPNNHVLVLGQVPADETVNGMSFGNHWDKLSQIIDKLIKGSQYPIVLKMHPVSITNEHKEYYQRKLGKYVNYWKEKGVTVIDGRESLHDILPKSRVAIIENSTAGLECLFHEVPIISYGYPEYHWVTKDMRHITWLNNYVNDISWYDNELAKKWVTWYCTKYQCYDQQSTKKRLKEILNID